MPFPQLQTGHDRPAQMPDNGHRAEKEFDGMERGPGFSGHPPDQAYALVSVYHGPCVDPKISKPCSTMLNDGPIGITETTRDFTVSNPLRPYRHSAAGESCILVRGFYGFCIANGRKLMPIAFSAIAISERTKQCSPNFAQGDVR